VQEPVLGHPTEKEGKEMREITVREFFDRFVTDPGEVVLSSDPPGEQTTASIHLSIEQSDDGRLYLCDVAGDVGLDDSEKPIAWVIARWMEMVNWPEDEEAYLAYGIPEITCRDGRWVIA
jgi:hypothetical protein